MSQHDLIIDNASGASVRADLNNALAALGSSMKGPNAPPAPVAGMIWVDDDTPSATVWTVKQYDGAEWIELGRLDITNNAYTPSEGVIAWADVASAATVDLGAQASRNLRVTGTTTITSFGTAASGVRRELRFAAALTLTNSGSLILPGGANITTAAGDTATAISLGSGNWVITDYQRAAGVPVAQMATARVLGRVTAGSGVIEEIPIGNPAAALSLGVNLSVVQNTTSGTSRDFTGIPAGVREIIVMLDGVSTSGTSNPLLQIGDGGGIEVTGYNSVSDQGIDGGSGNIAVSSTGFGIRSASAGATISGAAILSLLDVATNTWAIQGLFCDPVNIRTFRVSGTKALSAELDRIRLTTASGADTFDAGKMNISWKF